MLFLQLLYTPICVLQVAHLIRPVVIYFIPLPLPHTCNPTHYTSCRVISSIVSIFMLLSRHRGEMGTNAHSSCRRLRRWWLRGGLVHYFFIIVQSENHVESLFIFDNLWVADGKVLGVFENRPIGMINHRLSACIPAMGRFNLPITTQNVDKVQYKLVPHVVCNTGP